MAANKKTPMKQEKGSPAAKGKVVAIISVLALILIAAAALLGRGLGGSPEPAANDTAPVTADQDLVIPIGEITETAKFYPVDIEETRLEVVAVKASDGTIRTAFNTCQVCFDSGRGYYKQQGNVLVCQNCGNRFPMDSVEVEAGGCNPWPIFDENKTVTDSAVTISYDFLKESEGIFANWKSSY